MRFITLLALVVGLLIVPVLATGCCSGQPQVTLRNPFLVDAEPSTIAGPRLMQTRPTYVAPSYSVPSGCAPGGLPPGYTVVPQQAVGTDPCQPPGYQPR